MTGKKLNSRGSILIWTVLLGVSLATVFFYVAQRLNFNMALQRRSIEFLHARQFIESYADYLESLSKDELVAIMDGNIHFEGISGQIHNRPKQIIGSLDVWEVAEYEVLGGGAKIEWNLCAKNEIRRELDVSPNDGMTSGNCGMESYDAIAQSPGPTITLQAKGAPVSYKITPLEGAVLIDYKWTMDIELILGPRQKINIRREFVPQP